MFSSQFNSLREMGEVALCNVVKRRDRPENYRVERLCVMLGGLEGVPFFLSLHFRWWVGRNWKYRDFESGKLRRNKDF